MAGKWGPPIPRSPQGAQAISAVPAPSDNSVVPAGSAGAQPLRLPEIPPPVTTITPRPVTEYYRQQPEPPPPSNMPVYLDENGNVMQPYQQQIGRNGLLGNPSVDPPSAHGAAYSRAY